MNIETNDTLDEWLNVGLFEELVKSTLIQDIQEIELEAICNVSLKVHLSNFRYFCLALS